MLDILEREILQDDEVILSRGSGVVKCKYIKETKCNYYFKLWDKGSQTYLDWSFYIIKGGGNDRFYKL